MANRLKPEKLAAMLDVHSVGAGVREIERATGVARETTRTTLERVVAERVRLAELALEYFAMFLVPGPGEEIINEICRSLLETCPLHPGFVRDDDDDVIGCTICARDAKARLSDGLKRHHARRKAEGRPIIPPRKKTAPTPSPVPPTPTPPSPSVRTKAQPKPVLSTVLAPPLAPVVPLELGAVVPGPAPKGRRHGVTRLEIQGHQATKEGRQRVCAACVGPQDADLGKFRRLSADPCARCGKPAGEGHIVRVRKEPGPDRVVSQAVVTTFTFGT